MTMLLIATVSTLSQAQTPAAPPTTTDSAAKDSTAPKKTGRFGGLMNKAKAAANNKTVQAVAHNETVQGAAKGVACTVVPGVAVANAVTGTGPCANSGLMNGLITGNLKGAAAAAAGGTATTGAAAAAAKLVGKGGVTGSAARGAMGAAGGMGGLTNGAAQAAAMRMMMGAGANGMSNAAAQAAAMKMLQTNGMSNAAAAAAISQMMKNGGAGLTGDASDAAAAAKIMQLMQAGMNPTGTPVQLAVASPAAVPAAVWVNYDFVPGERAIYYADFTDDQVGNFPARLQFVEGSIEVAELGGRRVLRATSYGRLTIPLPEVLPQRFTIEIDVINRPTYDGADFHLRGSVGRIDDAGTSIIGWGSDGASQLGGGGGEVKLAYGDALHLRYRGKPAQLRILGDGKYVKVYLDEKRMANVPNANFEHSKVLHMFIDARGDDNAAYISRIRVAESRKGMYDDLAANGHVATQGLLFDTGSDRLAAAVFNAAPRPQRDL